MNNLHLSIYKILDLDYTPLLQKYPFLTYLVYGGNDYIGVVQNVDDLITTIYDYGSLKTLEQKEQFVQLVDDLCEQYAKTLIYVSHYENEIPLCINQVFQLNQGKQTIYSIHKPTHAAIAV